MGSTCKCPGCGHAFHWGHDADSDLVLKQGPTWKSCAENGWWKLSFHIQEAHPDLLVHCARRSESAMGLRDARGDYWYERDHHRVCSYCGSMHPDDFLQAAESGCELGPTDKSYKVYVSLVHPEPEKLRVHTAITFQPSEAALPSWTKVTDENRHLLTESGWGTYNTDYTYFQQMPNGAVLHTKFYFQHLSVEQQQLFIDLLNAKKLKIGMPGYFYARPFFIAPAEPQP